MHGTDNLPGRQPAIPYVHGGGWVSGDRTDGYERRVLRPLLAASFIVTTIDYRLAPKHKHPAQIQDASCAVRFMRASADDLGIDPERIGVMGDSAGGHLAALVALTDPTENFADCSKIKAAAVFYGVFDLVEVEPSLAVEAVENNFPNPEDKESGSPLRYVDAQAPAFLIIHGKQDRIVDIAQSRKLAAALNDAGKKPIFITVENGGHGFVERTGKIDPNLDDITRTLVEFFKTNLN